jgi:hypothetical protein
LGKGVPTLSKVAIAISIGLVRESYRHRDCIAPASPRASPRVGRGENRKKDWARGSGAPSYYDHYQTNC